MDAVELTPPRFEAKVVLILRWCYLSDKLTLAERFYQTVSMVYMA